MVYNSTTNAVIYDQIQDSLKLSHTLAANTLQNGTIYNCTISAFDINNTETMSSKVSFICLTTPTFNLNVSANQVIANSNFTANIIYNQIEGELLNEYTVTLYSESQSQLWTSGIKYNNNLSTEINGLLNSMRYTIRAIGATVNGFQLDTGYISFIVEYESTELFSVLRLENRETEGSVRIISNIVLIEGIANPTPPQYINHDLIDLSAPNSTVTFDDGFSLSGDYLVKCKGCNFPVNATLLTLTDKVNLIDIIWRKGKYEINGVVDTRCFIELKVDLLYYVIFSNYLSGVLPTDMIYIWFRKQDNHFEVKIENLGGVS